MVIPSLTTPYDAFQIDMYAQTMTGDVWLDDLEIIETYALSFQKESMIMNVDEELELELTIDNEDAFTNEEIHWESSNEEVAVVDETGVVTALSPGTAVITAMTDDLHKVTCQISAEDAAMKEFYETMRDNWRDRLTGNHADTSDKDNQELIKDITAEAQKFWDDINKVTGDTDKRKTLWDDLNLTVKFVSGSSDSKLSEDFNTAFSRLSAMATEALGTVTGFVTEGDGFYEDGSCIQHTSLAYTGGYGATLLSGYEWFYFNEEGLMQTGWVTINGQTFYLQPASDGTRGVMLAGWHKIDGRWYHFQTESDGNRGMLLN